MAKQKLNTFGRVRALEGWKSVAFGAALLERMLPNYTLFCELTESGDAHALRNCLNLVWETLKSPKSNLISQCSLKKWKLPPRIPANTITMACTLLLMQPSD